ncbi:MAG: DUF5615 family PIN-like protein [Chloroflexi bacterium]|nr:DUF5615 family PIN-like protein [Chloroflexota bacterium]
MTSEVRFKLDENLPAEMTAQFEQEGHDTATIVGQGMAGARDYEVANACVEEERVLVTLDTDFANITSYPPANYFGIVVFRLNDQSRDRIAATGDRFLRSLTTDSLAGQLWIVEEARIRIRD